MDLDDFENDDLDLTPDMSRVWGQVLRGLRESGETMLHAACIDLSSVDYTRDTIEITCKDDSLYNLLTKHKTVLEKFAGVGSITILKNQTQPTANKDIITRLGGLFGGRLTVVRK